MVRDWICSRDFPLWRVIAVLVDWPSSSRLWRAAAVSIRYNRWRRRLARLGDATIIYPNVVIHSPEHVEIGRNVAIAEFVHMWGGGGISIGDDVMIASHVVITSQTHDTGIATRRVNVARPVRIMENVWIGAGAIVLPGVTIGAHAIVAAGAVVTTDVPQAVVVVGVPARVVRSIDASGPHSVDVAR